MKITFLMGTFPWKPSGGAQVAYNYANLLAARGHEVHVQHARCLPNWKRTQAQPLTRRLKGFIMNLIERFRQPRPAWFDLDQRITCRSVAQYSDNTVPRGDAVIATFWPTAEIACHLPKSKGARFYLVQHFESWAGDAERIEATWRAPLHKLFVSKWLYRKALAFKIPNHELTYLPNAIDHTHFPMRQPNQVRGQSVAMMYGEADWKGARYGIAALTSARKQVPSLQAVLFGVWRRPANLPAWIDYRQLPSKRELSEDIMGRAAIFVCPSLSEGWGLPSAEAMASGCALVTASNGGSDDFAIHEQTALVVSPGQAKPLTEAILRLLQYPSLRERLASGGRELVLGFQWARSAERLETKLISMSAGMPLASAP